MSKSYKLLKDLPDVKAGTVISNYGIDLFCEKHWFNGGITINESIIKNNPDWFAPYAFTAEDGDIFVGDTVYCIFNSSPNEIHSQPVYKLEHIKNPGVIGGKGFTTKEAAEKYLESLKPKFKVGDIITITEGEIEGYSLKIEYFEEEDGVMYAMWTKDMNEQIRGACFDYIRLATNEEIIQYYSEQGWVKNTHALYNGHNVTIINIFISNDNVFVNHSLGTTSILYEGLRLLTNDEIIEYYKDSGWVKGAKFKYGQYEGVVDFIKIDNNILKVYCTDLAGQTWIKLTECELIKEPNYPKSFRELNCKNDDNLLTCIKSLIDLYGKEKFKQKWDLQNN